MRVDSFAINIGLPVGVNYLRERYGLPKPKPGDRLATPSANPLEEARLAAARR
ncbi:hypothetical protein D3C83_260410 [compost metagenome]